VGTLSGSQGEGVVSRLRQGFALDDFDVTTDAEGNTGVRAGKYISRRIYTDVAVDATGRSELNLNIDVTKSLKARGSVANDGSTGLGMFFERDY
jgi:translocation and assembly module TamB